MIFGMRSGNGGRTKGVLRGAEAAVVPFVVLIVVAALAALLLAGCSGGGSSSSPTATPTPGGNGNQATGSVATLTGSVVDQYSGNAAVAGAVVAFGPYYTTTDSTGSFTLAIPASTPGNLRVYGKSVKDANGNLVLANGLPTSDGTYRDTGYYAGSLLSIGATGIPISAQAANQIDSIGTITLLSTNGPPPPPIL
jgi:hypothetical protein